LTLPKNITSVVIDDEPLARKGVEILISESENITHLGSFENALRSIDFLKNNQVDLLFLDIGDHRTSGRSFLH